MTIRTFLTAGILLVCALPLQAKAEQCDRFIDRMFNGTGFNSSARDSQANFALATITSVSTRNGQLRSSFGVAPGLTSDDIWPRRRFRRSSSGADRADLVSLSKSSDGRKFEGRFNRLTPRANERDRADETTLTIRSDGRVIITLNRWNNTVLPLEDVNCYAGHQNGTFMISGFYREGHGGRTIWSISISPQVLI